MTTYPVDIDTGQIVHWLLDATRRHEEGLRIRATRQYVLEPAARSQIESLGDEEAEELSEVTAIGLLEIEPPPTHEGWILRVRVEHELGPRVLEEESVDIDEEEIDLEVFKETFIRSGRGMVEVIAEVTDRAAKRRLDRLLAKMREDRHLRRRA